MSATYLKSCHRINNSLCPIFRLGDMVREAGENFHEMAVEVRSPDSWRTYLELLWWQWIKIIIMHQGHALFLLFIKCHQWGFVNTCFLHVKTKVCLFLFLEQPQGGVIGIQIKWDCNLDPLMHHCLPRYSFRRLDEKESNRTLYPGLNFRWTKGQKSRFPLLMLLLTHKYRFISLCSMTKLQIQ